MKWLTKLFKSNNKESETTMKKFLIVGLGNIGIEYVNTRHNIGFKVLDHFAKKEGLTFSSVKLGSLTQFNSKGRLVLLLKPNTYMNLSGSAVKFWMDKEKIEKENVLVITDDLNLEFGTIRIKPKGTDGGHNGLKNIQLLLQSSEYPRFRFGISDSFKKGKQVDYVLGDWDEIEKAKLPERLDVGIEIIKSFVLAGLENTMTSYNGK